MAYRPKIGITERLELHTRRFYLGRDYSEALEAAGAIPIHLPLIPKSEYVAAVLEDLDGILLPGCDSDVDPARYGEDPHPKLGTVVPEKDETDLLVLGEAERLNLSVLAICFGSQVLNVSRGGSLYQDIESQIGNCIKHGQGVPRDRNSHGIRIEENSYLASITGRGSDDGNVRVNSHHHQAIKTVGKDLAATAWASDGVVEFVEDTRKGRFVIGVQWHPELSWDTDPLSRRIFEEFVESCLQREQIAPS